MRLPVEPGTPERGSFRRIGLWMAVGGIAFAVWLVIAAIVGNDRASLFTVLAPSLALGVLASFAGWRGDRHAAFAIVVGGIAAAAAIAWAAGAVGVEPGADPAMRSSYHAMLVVIAGATAAIVASLSVATGYVLGRRTRRATAPASDPP